jgi:MFS family permease
LVLAILLSISALLVLIFLADPPHSSPTSPESKHLLINESSRDTDTHLKTSSSSSFTTENISSSSPPSSPSSLSSFSSFVGEYSHLLSSDILLLLSSQFILIFIQQTLETIVTPLTTSMYGWTEMKNSLMYLAIGILILIGFILLFVITSKYPHVDLLLLFIGYFLEAIALTFGAVIFHGDLSSVDVPLYLFSLLLILVCAGLPLLSLSISSIFSKLIKKSLQGRSQGVMSAVVNLACILSPLWAGYMLQYLRVLFIVMLTFEIILWVVCIVAWRFFGIFGKKKFDDTDVETVVEKEEILGNDRLESKV